MTDVRLWAPTAHQAAAHVGSQILPMSPAGTGSWSIDLPPETDYLLSVDDGEPRPDPRSARQPHGVHGPSRTYDAVAFPWTDGGWAGRDLIGAVFYELHVGTFTPAGTLDAAIAKLGHLAQLGVEAIELMPVASFPGTRGWGYDGVALYAVHESYGGPAALQRFVNAAHDHGVAVCLDVVYNHFGPDGNYTANFGPYLTDKHHTPWGSAINLDDTHADGVRAFLIDNACRWLRDFHIDALRLDAVHALVDDSPQHLLAELSQRVGVLEQELNRPLTLIAESDLNQPSMVLPLARGGYGMDAQWADDVHHALHAWLTGEHFGYYCDFGSADTLAQAFTEVFVHAGSWSTFRGQEWGAPVPADIPRQRFVTFTQNHDQVGNRGLGDRPDARLEPGVVAGGAALLLLGPFTPLLFQGQEWGTRRPFQFFTDHHRDLGVLVTQGRAEEFTRFGWEEIYGPDAEIPDPQATDTFIQSTLDWDELQDSDHAAMLTWYRTLIQLRRSHLTGATAPSSREDYQVTVTDTHMTMRHGPLTVIAAPHGDVKQPKDHPLLASFGALSTNSEHHHIDAGGVAVFGELP